MLSLDKQIFLTGSSGFVGTSVMNYYGTDNIHPYKRGNDFNIDSTSVVIHVAGKAHDLKNTSSPNDYYHVNTELTKTVFDKFLVSDAKVFITLSSVKAVADEVRGELTELHSPNPITHYGKSKLLAEEYIFSKEIPERKRIYILRPCVIHGPGNKGNLNLLCQLVSKRIPWPLGAFQNKRSFCSIDNLLFVINELIEREDITSGIYNVADDEALSTNELIELIATTTNKKTKILSIPKKLITVMARIGDLLQLPLNTERLGKLTENFVVSNTKIKTALQIEKMPISVKEGLIKTIKSFN